MQTNADVRNHILEERKLLRTRMKKIKHKIAVISGKGGVGKTVTAVNLAMALAMHGHACMGARAQYGEASSWLDPFIHSTAP